MPSPPPTAHPPFQRLPAVVGTVSTRAQLDALAAAPRPPACDVLELRLDQVGWDGDWLEACARLDARAPVVLTLRLAAEGGAWEDGDTARADLLHPALDHISALDLELRSPLLPRFAAAMAERGKAIVVSHHDFESTPPTADIVALIERMEQHPNAVAKAAFTARDESDVARLRGLLSRPGAVPLCLIAMGEAWAGTRATFPEAGSALTYGYLDRPSAPGQLSCAELLRRLRGEAPDA